MSQPVSCQALAALQTVAALTTATSNALAEAIAALDATGRDDLRRQLEKVSEFHRLVAGRVAAILRLAGEG